MRARHRATAHTLEAYVIAHTLDVWPGEGAILWALYKSGVPLTKHMLCDRCGFTEGSCEALVSKARTAFSRGIVSSRRDGYYRLTLEGKREIAAILARAGKRFSQASQAWTQNPPPGAFLTLTKGRGREDESEAAVRELAVP